MIGRPRQFCRDQALDQAIELFQEQGYEATGIAQISETLGIGRQSLYGTFGDKRSLFVEALRRYSDESIGWLRATLNGPGRAIDHIETVLDTWAARGQEDSHCGCFMTNSISELGFRDPELAGMLSGNLSRMATAFQGAIERAQAEGDIAADRDSEALAKLLVNTAQGLSVSGKVDGSYARDVIAQVKTLLQ